LLICHCLLARGKEKSSGGPHLNDCTFASAIQVHDNDLESALLDVRNAFKVTVACERMRVEVMVPVRKRLSLKEWGAKLQLEAYSK